MTILQNIWKNKLIILVYGLLVACGLLFYYFRTVSFGTSYVYNGQQKKQIQFPYKSDLADNPNPHYEIALYSKLEQNVSLHVAVDDIIEEFTLNDIVLDIDWLKRIYKQKQLDNWKNGYIFNVRLKQGWNKALIKSKNLLLGYSIKIQQKPFTADFVLYIIVFVIPIVHVLVLLFLYLFTKFNNIRAYMRQIPLPLLLLLIGIALRLLYVYVFYTPDYRYYNHDYLEHLEYIKFVAKNLTLPQVDKALEFPQQPLYYFLTGGLYRLSYFFNLTEIKIVMYLTWFSTLLSIIGLWFVYRIARLLSPHVKTQAALIGFMAFTPYFVYMAGMVNNDSLAAALSLIALFYIIRFYSFNLQKDFYLALIFCVFNVFSKISAGITMALLMLILLSKYSTVYYNRLVNVADYVKLKWNILIIAFVGILCLGISLHRAYIPSSGEFRFVESYVFDKQGIKSVDIPYLFSFKYFDLIVEAQAHVFGRESIVQSFPSFLYGSFFFGEYDYRYIFKHWPIIKIIMQLVMVFGIIFPIGFFAFLFFIKRSIPLFKIIAVGVVLNLLLIIKFLLDYPSVCNSDFRYFVPVFCGIGILSALGLENISDRFLKIRKPLQWMLGSLFVFEILFMLVRILLRLKTNM